MSNIIEEIYNGDLLPIDKLCNTDKEYRKVMEKVIAAENALLNAYPEVTELFEKYQDADGQMISLSNSREFVKGFKIGAQVALEIMKPID